MNGLTDVLLEEGGDGSLVEEICAKELAEKCRTSLKISVDNVTEAIRLLEKEYSEIEATGERNVSVYSKVEDSSLIVEALVKNGIRVYEVVNEIKSLEDFFVERLG